MSLPANPVSTDERQAGRILRSLVATGTSDLTDYIHRVATEPDFTQPCSSEEFRLWQQLEAEPDNFFVNQLRHTFGLALAVVEERRRRLELAGEPVPALSGSAYYEDLTRCLELLPAQLAGLASFHAEALASDPESARLFFTKPPQLGNTPATVQAAGQ